MHHPSAQERLAYVRHELRSPLTIAQGYVELALELLRRYQGSTQSPTPQQLAEFATLLEHAVQGHDQLLALVADLDAKEPDLFAVDLHPVDLVTLVKTTLDTYAPLFPDTPLIFDDAAGDTPPSAWVMGDSLRLSQVLVNYLDNARTYSTQDTPVTVSIERGMHNVLVKVTDQGIGMSPVELEHIWEPGYRTPQAQSARLGGGSGLGLSVVQHIIHHHHHGSVGVQSQLGHGSVFWFELPLREGATR